MWHCWVVISWSDSFGSGSRYSFWFSHVGLSGSAQKPKRLNCCCFYFSIFLFDALVYFYFYFLLGGVYVLIVASSSVGWSSSISSSLSSPFSSSSPWSSLAMRWVLSGRLLWWATKICLDIGGCLTGNGCMVVVVGDWMSPWNAVVPWHTAMTPVVGSAGTMAVSPPFSPLVVVVLMVIVVVVVVVVTAIVWWLVFPLFWVIRLLIWMLILVVWLILTWFCSFPLTIQCGLWSLGFGIAQIVFLDFFSLLETFLLSPFAISLWIILTMVPRVSSVSIWLLSTLLALSTPFFL